MRIIGGQLAGRQFESPHGHRTRPMSDRVRGALFNMLGDISGLSVLDVYAGSGALGLEALSRGAASVQFVEMDAKASQTIGRNIETLRLAERAKNTRANVEFWSKRNPDLRYDLVLADPPYDDINLSTINLLATHIKNKGLMVLSHPGREPAPTVNGVVVVDNRSYGDAALAYYRLVQDD
jgi:16S rRNA (guanine966-N2)-methyltransferase